MLSEFLNLEALNISLAYPFLFLILIAILLLLIAAFVPLHYSFYMSVSALSLIGSFLLILYNLSEFGFSSAFLGTLNNSSISLCASSLILLFAFLYLLMQKEEKSEFYVLFLFMIASLELMVSSSNLILIFIGLESSSLALYTMIAMRGSKNSISSAIKYFSLGAVGSGFFVFACALIYARTGSLDLDPNLLVGNTQDNLLLLAGVLIFILCAIKLSLVPFHFWLRDVYYGAHTNLVAFISVVPKIAMFAVVVKICFFLRVSGFESVVIALAVFSMLASSIAALSQNDIKKMLAYSSVLNSSFVVLALVVFSSSLSKSSFISADFLGDFFYFDYSPIFMFWFLFGFANYGIFLILSTFKKSNYESLNGLLVQKPLRAFALSICVLSLAGIPPFGFFWAKFIILSTTLVYGGYLAFFVALSSVIILYAYLKILIHALFLKGEPIVARFNFGQKFVLIFCIFVNIFTIFLMF